MALQFRWKATFSLLNVSLSENKPFAVDGLQFETHPKSTKETPKIRVTYRFATSNHPSDISKQAKETIDKFLDSLSLETVLTGWDIREAMEEFEIELENRIEVIRAGQPGPTKFTATFHNTSTFTDEFALHAWRMTSEIATMRDSNIIFRIMRLLRQSVLEDDEYDRFSKGWRSFNTFYNHVAQAPKLSEVERIRTFSHRLTERASPHPEDLLRAIIRQYWTPLPSPVEIEDYLTFLLVMRNWRSVMDCFVKQNFIDSRRNTPYSRNLAKAIEAKDLGKAVENALLGVYTERNKVIHGEVVSDEERDLLYVCSAFIQRIVGVGLNEFYFMPLKERKGL